MSIRNFNKFLTMAQGGNFRTREGVVAYDGYDTVSYWRQTGSALTLLATQEAGRDLDPSYSDDLRLPDLEALLQAYLKPFAVEKQQWQGRAVDEPKRFATKDEAVDHMMRLAKYEGLTKPDYEGAEPEVKRYDCEHWGVFQLDREHTMNLVDVRERLTPIVFVGSATALIA